jgi:uncharacterized protein
MPSAKLDKQQIKKGFFILITFVILRGILADIGKVDQGLQINSRSILFLTSAFFILSVGLVYLGFTKWVGIDLKQWWQFGKQRIWGDVVWGLLGAFIGLVLSALVILPFVQLGWITENITNGQVLQASPLTYLLSLFFGFAIAGFQEETIFRGFLQNVLKERFGNWQGNVLQATVFSIAHIGYLPWEKWPLLILVFVLGILFGWLRMKRGTLIAPWIAHGLIG